VPYTLLLADDSVTIQRVIELTFADEDVTVVAVSDGDQAIERLEASPPDIVLADIGMPGKNGYEVAQFMRRSPKLAHIPVVLLTGAFEPVDQARANAAGCDGVLAKPFEPQLVIGRVKELLARGQRTPDAPAPDLKDAVDDTVTLPPPAPKAPASDSIWAPPVTETRPVTPFVDPPIAEPSSGPVPRSELNDYFDRLDAAFSNLSGGAPAASPASAPKPIADPQTAPIAAEIDWFTTPSAPAASSSPWQEPPPADDAAIDLPMSYASPQPEVAAPALDEDAGVAEPDDRLAPIEESMPVASEPPPAAETAPDPFVFVVPAAPPVVAPPPAAPAPAPSAPAAAASPAAVAAPALEVPLPNPPPLPPLADAFAALLAAEQSDPDAAAHLWPAAVAASAESTPAVGDEVIEEIVRRVLDRLSDTVVRDAVSDATANVAERLVREEIARIKASIK